MQHHTSLCHIVSLVTPHLAAVSATLTVVLAQSHTGLLRNFGSVHHINPLQLSDICLLPSRSCLYKLWIFLDFAVPKTVNFFFLSHSGGGFLIVLDECDAVLACELM